jgi:protein-L-isoaspartate(D-aspartate) O-methyltransferase
VSTHEELLAHVALHVADPRVMEALAAVPRELFVPPARRAEAWRNEPLPIGDGQTISQPLVVARMCEVLELTGADRVLDVGTGSGYHAAILSRLAAEVWSVEVRPELARQAEANLAAAGVQNVTVVVADGALGHPAAAPYDAVNVAAAAPEIPAALEAQLAPGGRLVMPLGARVQRLVRVRRLLDATLDRRLGDAVRFVPLVGPESVV